MKTKLVLAMVLVAAVSAGVTWFILKQGAAQDSQPAAKGGKRRILYYQSAMHPWIKSDKPGRCTICGMELAPVYEGEKGFDVAEGIISLGSNVIQVIHAQSEEVKRRPLLRTLRVAGEINESDARHRIVSAYVDGRIDKLNVNFIGAEVVEGQPLATLYSPILLATEREYLALLKQKPASGAATLTAENDRLISAAGERLKRLGLAEAQIKALPAKNENDIHTEVLAPMSGTVVARFVYEGQYVKEGEKLFDLADFSKMWFLFDAYERDLAWLEVGQKVDLTTPSVPGKTYQGTIAFFDPNLKDMTRSAKVRVELDNPLIEQGGRSRRALLQKLYADGVVHLGTPQALTVPRTAVLMPGPRAVVYVDKGGGSYEQRPVKLGRAGDSDWEVLDGLTEGEKVVTTGNLLIDAQAQLNSAIASVGTDSAKPGASSNDLPRNTAKAVSGTPLNEMQQQIVSNFLAAASAVAQALSSDSVDDFNQQAPKVQAAVAALHFALEKTPSWHPLIQSIEDASKLEKAADLRAARKAFLPFSIAVVRFAKQVRASHSAFSSLKIYRCPMVDQAIPGAPKAGEWMQLQAPLRNPFFGAEMLECGTEVKP